MPDGSNPTGLSTEDIFIDRVFSGSSETISKLMTLLGARSRREVIERSLEIALRAQIAAEGLLERSA